MNTEAIDHSLPATRQMPPDQYCLRWRPRALMAALLGILLLMPGAAHSDNPEELTICHGFGCRFEQAVSITREEWNQVQSFFRDAAQTPAEERVQIKKATGWLDVIVGRHTPIHLNKAQNELSEPGELIEAGIDSQGHAAKFIGQLDCIDESRNITTYMRLMEQAGLLQHHRVVERAHRKSAFDQHYAGQIEEIETGTRWVVDSWFYGYGSLPYVEEATEWHDLSILSSTSFPVADDG